MTPTITVNMLVIKSAAMIRAHAQRDISLTLTTPRVAVRQYEIVKISKCIIHVVKCFSFYFFKEIIFTSNHLQHKPVGSIPAQDFGLFHVRKLSS